MTETIQLGDVGVAFILTFMEDGAVVDVSGATSVKRVLFKKPTGAYLSKSAVFVTNGTDGKIKYTTLAADLDVLGTWQIQGYVEIGTNKFHSETSTFTVAPNLE